MFYYFGYGSNINMTSLKAKGVVPHRSQLAVLPSWKLLFNVQHWFRHEGGVGNIHPSQDPTDQVQGLVHLCEDEHLAMLDAAEAYGVGYDRITVDLDTDEGKLSAITYVGIPGYLDDACLPTRRYLNILLKGAMSAGLNKAYIEKLREHPIHPEHNYPPFQHPAAISMPIFNQQTLAQYPLYTALAGAVFDMQHARAKLDCLRGLFGGKDMTLFHLKRLDTSDGSEVLDDIRHDRISAAGRKYLNAYLHEYDAEFKYVGRYVYD
ncbi:MAG: gamma-glutamylcyclotransferase [Gallionella sp.]|nr:gamma-glutamylcyclotransferase [Gallionella sp.]MDD4958159.1 gamma-glutamylcyclotransferase [Gallionella sp.]